MKFGSFGRSFVVVAMFMVLLSPAAGIIAQTRSSSGPGAAASAAPKAGGKPAAKPTPPSKSSSKLPPGVQEQPGLTAPTKPELAGGPDGFGYLFTDNNSGGVNYAFVDAGNLVNALHNTDDGHVTDALPFPISIYGHSSLTLTISTNGIVHLNDDYCSGNNPTQCNYLNKPLPSSSAPNGTVAPYWDDLDPTHGGDVFTDVVGTAPNRTYLVEWRDVPLWNADNPGSTDLDFEVIFTENSTDIIFQYKTLTGVGADGSSATVGIQNLDRSVGLQYSNEAAVITEGLAIRYYLQNGTVISIDSANKNAAPGTPITYTMQLINQTGGDNSYTLGASNSQPGFSSVVNPTAINTIAQNDSIPIKVRVNVPLTATLGLVNVTTVQITAATNGGGCPDNNCSVTVLLMTTVNTLGIGFSPGNREGVGSTGGTVSYTSTLTNETGITNRFIFSLAGSAWTPSVVPTTTGSVAPGATAQVVVKVPIPVNAALGARDTVTLTAQSTLPTVGAYSGRLVLTTVAGNWATRGFMHNARARHGLADYPPNGYVYALGGEGFGNNRDLPIEEFDPGSGSWATRTKLGTGVSNVGAATIGDLIYVPGGFDGTQAVDLLQTYNPQTNVTDTVTTDPLPQAMFAYGLVAFNSKLYLIGGSDMSGSLKSVYVYDPNGVPTHRWTQMSDMPTRRAFLALAVLDNKIYATGGVNSISDLTDLALVEVYDPASNSWTTGTNLRVPRGGDGAVGVPAGQPCGGFLYVVGGGWYTPTATVERYSAADGWSKLADIQEPRRNIGFTYAVSRGLLVSAGGFSNDYSNVTEVLGCGSAVNPLPTETATPLATATPIAGATATPTATPPPGTGCDFNDVPTDFWGYVPITWLACRDMVSGYADHSFRPFNNMTRGQITKVIVLGQGWELLNPATPTFTDVAPANTFYRYIETAYSHRIISGYADGTFQWTNNVTRGQIAKIIVAAVGFDIDTGGGPHFSDVAPSNTFYGPIETAYNKGLISGYADGTFRWTANATRAQVSKIVYIAVH